MINVPMQKMLFVNVFLENQGLQSIEGIRLFVSCELKKFRSIHLFLDWVRFLGKDVLEISELNSNTIIGNLYM